MRKLLIGVMVITLTWGLGALNITDPNDRLYDHLDQWENAGYTHTLPVIQPYSLQEITALLREVTENGDSRSRSRAEKYLTELTREGTQVIPGKDGTGKSLPGGIRINATNETLLSMDAAEATAGPEYTMKTGGNLTANGFLGPAEKVSYGGMLELSLIDKSTGWENPCWRTILNEYRSGGGVLEVGEKTLDIGQIGLAGVFFGTQNLNFRTGIMRTSFGPFFENGGVISPSAPATGHFSLNYTADWFSISSLMMELNAKYSVTPDKILIRNTGPEEKFLYLHTYRFTPWNWMNFGIIQTTVSSGRFSPVYMIPLQYIFFTQQHFLDWDNTLLGFYFTFNIPGNLQLNTSVYVDDFDSFSSSEKQTGSGVNWGSAQNKVAFKTGMSWSPFYSILNSIDLSYLLITQYMYTHYSTNTINNLTYTTGGAIIGSTLPPNSDELYLKINLEPTTFINLDLWSRYARHGNASEDEAEGDGSVWDSGLLSNGTVTFYGPSRTLNQEVLQEVLQAGLEASATFAFGPVQTALSVEYYYQYVWNRDLIAGNNDGTHFLEISSRVAY